MAAGVIVAGVVYAALELREDPKGEAEAPLIAPTAAPPPFPPAPAPSAQEKFQQKLKAAQETMPTSEQLAELPEEQVHGTPQPLIQASIQIGEIAEAIAKNPALGEQGMEFYGNCARRRELAVSVRAHCLHNLRALGQKRGEEPDENGIAAGVLKLEGPAQH